MYALSAHLVVRADLGARESDELLLRVTKLLKSRHHIAHATLQIETEEFVHHVEHCG